MTMEYIRKTYEVPKHHVKRGAAIKYFASGEWQTGHILSADHRLWVRLEHGGRVCIHPEDPNLKYLGVQTFEQAMNN